jgi:hypothetical protein
VAHRGERHRRAGQFGNLPHPAARRFHHHGAAIVRSVVCTPAARPPVTGMPMTGSFSATTTPRSRQAARYASISAVGSAM